MTTKRRFSEDLYWMMEHYGPHLDSDLTVGDIEYLRAVDPNCQRWQTLGFLIECLELTKEPRSPVVDNYTIMFLTLERIGQECGITKKSSERKYTRMMKDWRTGRLRAVLGRWTRKVGAYDEPNEWSVRKARMATKSTVAA